MICFQTFVILPRIAQKKTLPVPRRKVGSRKSSGPRRLWKEMLDSGEVEDPLSQLWRRGLQTLSRPNMSG